MSIVSPAVAWSAPRQTEASTRRGHWSIAFGVALSLHAAAIAVLIFRPSLQPPPTTTVVAVDLIAPPQPSLPEAKLVASSPTSPPAAHEPSRPAAISVPSSDWAAAAIAALPTAEAPSAPPAVTGARSADWAATLLARLEQVKRYPPEAAMQNQQGVVQLRFVIDRSGAVHAAKIEQSSGYDLLDREALAMVRRAQPLPPPPAQMSGASFDIVLPIRFSLKS